MMHGTDQPGETTTDLLALGEPLPDEHGLRADEREDHIRSRGHRNRILGPTIIASTVIASLCVALLAENGLFSDRVAQLFAILSTLGLFLGGAMLTLAGSLEMMGRSSRAMTRKAYALATENAVTLKTVMGLVAPLPGRVELNGERIAAVERGMSDLAAYLPEVLVGEHWKGYAAAERDHETELTGTDGTTRRRSQHLGIVPNSKTGDPR